MKVSLIQLLQPTKSLTGQVATIFPWRAEIMALDQSSSIAVEHSLPRSASNDLEKESIARARERETLSVLYDSESNTYTLVHPTLAHGDPAAFPIELCPQDKPTLIRILSPYESDKSILLALDLVTTHLEINSQSIAGLPSVYAMDTLISAMLCLLIRLHRSTSLLECHFPYLPHRPAASIKFDPPPRSSLFSPPLSGDIKGHKSKAWTRLRARKASDLELQEKTWTNAQLDLSHFYPFASEDESLSQGTRMCLKLLYWCFEALVWTMGSFFVRILAAGIVSIGSHLER